MVLVPDHPAAEAFAKQVPSPCPALVEALRVQATEAVHPHRHPLPLRLDQQMEVRVHQAPRVELPAERAAHAPQQELESQTVGIVETDALIADAVGGHVEHAVVREL